MKKILSILGCAALLFTACTEEVVIIEPVFPEEVVELELLAGQSKGIEIDANTSWTVDFADVQAEQYAFLIGPDEIPTHEISGEPGQTRIFVKAYPDIKNYDADIVFYLNLTMLNETQPIAKFTIKKIEKPASIVATETFETVTLAEGGHPSWGGEFANAAEKWSLAYTDKWDLEGVGMQCNLENVASITVHAYDAAGAIANVASFANPWVEVSTFGTQGGFKVIMDVNKDSAAWSLNAITNTYESYVNFRDAEGNILLSLYCTYKAPEESGTSGLALVNPGMLNTWKDNGDNTYQVTFYDSSYITAGGMFMYTAFTVPNYTMHYCYQEGTLDLKYDAEIGGYYVTLAEGASIENITDGEYNFDIYADSYMTTYKLTVVIDFVE